MPARMYYGSFSSIDRDSNLRWRLEITYCILERYQPKQAIIYDYPERNDHTGIIGVHNNEMLPVIRILAWSGSFYPIEEASVRNKLQEQGVVL